MTIFITFEYFVPAYKAGGPIQSLDNMVSNFTDENIQLYIYCSNKDLDGSTLNVITNSWQQYNKNTKVYYASAEKTKKTNITQLLDDIQPDIVFINGIFSPGFSLKPLMWKGKGRKILSARGMLHTGALSQKRLKKQMFLALFKLRGLHRKCEFHATTEEEAQFIQNIFGTRSKVWVAPNFPKIIGYQQPLTKQEGSLQMLSIALISPMKNIKLVIETLLQCHANICYDIYGPVKDAQYWQDCETLIKKARVNININYKGPLLPHKVAETLKSYHIMVQPSKSENFGHSIFEALSAGKPVITSRFTPWNELENQKAGFNVDIENIQYLQKSIEKVAAFDNNEYKKWTGGAYTYAMQKVDVPNIKILYKSMLGIS